MRRRLGILGAALGLLGVAAAPADAAVVSGSNLALAPNATICVLPGIPNLSCTTAITGLAMASRAPGGARAASDGVIVSWSLRAGASTIDHSVRLRVVRNDTGAGTGPTEVLPKAAGVYTYAARLPVGNGDLLGVDTLNVPEMLGVPIVRSPASGANLDYWSSQLADGETRAPFTNEAALELLMNATIEPDADNDGWGDETQDKCPTGAATGNEGCPPPKKQGPPPPSGESPIPTEPTTPGTKLGKGGPKGTTDKTKATFRFTATVAGSTFQCKLDKKPWKACKSPKTYKGLKEGRHTFKVRAVGVSGLIDTTPAKRAFKVEL